MVCVSVAVMYWVGRALVRPGVITAGGILLQAILRAKHTSMDCMLMLGFPICDLVKLGCNSHLTGGLEVGDQTLMIIDWRIINPSP